MGLLSCAGCSTTSTIYRLEEPPIEAKIVGGSRSALVVESEGRSYVIARDEVARIDYPGNVHTAVGASLLGYGVLNIAIGLPACRSDTEFSSETQQQSYCVGLFAPAVVGLGAVIYGLVVNQGQSRAAADKSLDVQPPPRLRRPPGKWPQTFKPIPAASAAPPASVAPPAPGDTPPSVTPQPPHEPAQSGAPPPSGESAPPAPPVAPMQPK